MNKERATMKKRKSANKINSVIRGIDREIRKEQGTLLQSRGRHVVHTSRAEKRRSRSSDRKQAINNSSE